jgi:hypothetical protein
MTHNNDDVPSVLDDDGPTDEDLAALAAEEPLIDAGIALVDAQIRAITAVDGPTRLDLLRVRRAQVQVARAALAYQAADPYHLLAARADQTPPVAGWSGPETNDPFPGREAA